MTRAEVVERFTIDRVLSSPARWNPVKLLDMNGIYIRAMTNDDVADQITPFLQKSGLVGTPTTPAEDAKIRGLVPLIHERLKELGEAPELLDFFFTDIPDPELDLLVPKKMEAGETKEALMAMHAALGAIAEWQGNEAALEAALRDICAQMDKKPGQLFGAIRVAVSARNVAPPLFEMLVALGRDKSLTRIAHAITLFA
jgi:glutamyl-tRNA synthetase